MQKRDMKSSFGHFLAIYCQVGHYSNWNQDVKLEVPAKKTSTLAFTLTWCRNFAARLKSTVQFYGYVFSFRLDGGT